MSNKPYGVRSIAGYSKTVVAAVDYIGNHRKTDVKPKLKTCPVSMVTANRLARLGLAMWLRGGCIMLTARGELMWTKLHPYSKYRIS